MFETSERFPSQTALQKTAGGRNCFVRLASWHALLGKAALSFRSYIFLILFSTAVSADDGITDQQLQFFESRIRPVLIEHCYDCHNSMDSQEAGLTLDFRGGVMAGGDNGPVVNETEPALSRLLAVMRHDIPGLEMPDGGPKLNDEVIADFESWILQGVPDPREKPPTSEEMDAERNWEATLERRKQWWSFRPIVEPEIPDLALGGLALGGSATSQHAVAWLENPIDRFVLRELKAEGLSPSPRAETETLIRRLFYSLNGIPPVASELAKWNSAFQQAGESGRDKIYSRLVDSLLENPRFGERWARYWMDWIRYAESHGSEGDPRIENAWLYRDYLIRALNSDVGYDQLLREHVAGDLLSSPRLNAAGNVNESLIGTSHWRMVFHGFAPTDALDERVRFTDDQINSFSKAFMGLTVSCARCHDHKFDAVSQEDYYALFGILRSCRPGREAIEPEQVLLRNQRQLIELKDQIRYALADVWLEQVDKQLLETVTVGKETGSAKESGVGFLDQLITEVVQDVSGNETLQSAWDAWVKRQLKDFPTEQPAVIQVDSRELARRSQWDLSLSEDYSSWYRSGVGLLSESVRAGAFNVATAGGKVVDRILPAGVYSNLISNKHGARLSSPDVVAESGSQLWVQVLGDSSASLRYVVQDYPRNGTVFPVQKLSPEWTWRRFDLSYWAGDLIHVELTTAKDAPLLVGGSDRSWFGVRQVRFTDGTGKPPSLVAEHLLPIALAGQNFSPQTHEDIVGLFERVLSGAIEGWKAGELSDQEALLLDHAVRDGYLPNDHEQTSLLEKLVATYRRLEAEVPVATRVPTLEETQGVNQRLFDRGDHKSPSREVPRRFLEAIDATPYLSEQSGRLELASDLLRDDNPLTRRVIVNRIWHHLFGQGLVRTPDNFGRLGAIPTHPQLLDWLALDFERSGYSLKRLIRNVVMTETWQQSSTPSELALAKDPENQWLSHTNIQRLEAEAIRDAMLAISGRLESSVGGAPTSGDSNRRSIYVSVIRNALDPFLRVWDFPEPFATVGRRSQTNVPAQSLTMLNDPRVESYAAAWAKRVLEGADRNDSERVHGMIFAALSRSPSAEEVEVGVEYVTQSRQAIHVKQQRYQALAESIQRQEKALDGIVEPIRSQLNKQRASSDGTETQLLPAPKLYWDFSKSDVSKMENSALQLRNGAMIRGGALELGNQGFAVSKPIGFDVSEKTLLATVQLSDIDQRGGGVLSLQTLDGSLFDAIVFGEQEPKHWLAGSNFFERTQPFGGFAESEADSGPVQIGIVYAEDGMVTCYRNGKPYGATYKTSGPAKFSSGEAVVTIGLRHLPASGNRLLRGQVFRAQVFDRALSASELESLYRSASGVISELDLVNAMSPAQVTRCNQLRSEIALAEQELESLDTFAGTDLSSMVWTDFAKSLFTLKEFIYVR